MEATMQISIDLPSWLLKDFSLGLYMYSFHFGSLTVKDWEDQSFQVTCCPYFPLVAYTDETQNDKISEAAIDYARMAFVKAYGLQAIGVRTCPDLSSMSSVTSPPLIQFFGIVDTSKLTLAKNPGIGLDNTTRNSSAILLTWSKFPNLENGVKPETGWYPNYIYAMLPKTKPHLTKKCQDYKADSTPFRKHGRKAYIRRPNNLEFVPFMEIMEVDWASDAKSIQDVPATPVKKEVKPEAASTGGKRKITFDPFADLGMVRAGT
ncbi:hypothetical protein V8E54_013507 [Elaphomyces granulatus]